MDPAEVPDQSEPRRRAARATTSQLFGGAEWLIAAPLIAAFVRLVLRGRLRLSLVA
ncbi:hypothetical protein EMIHUDRAFT_219863 [Emiliania huxleyi CCMP1516]|uniref:Uncharacterized protein n=2 Tax=Emiliania huxleyi TaxID=2903 RepID=A0A0D3I3E2_EMIH1|nr:hypothetical protein EMIHUDRAFT_219863 [Emiliania huxleyi CCMP1516]EOD05777.1 hypothetical protein EMIHUDRAFT_219863 [Emiliania huxleyi CCMP1516]|eukprot:XP_005758206.1 hypothetical protein EMIHUDRAFT_219863 [Emiliania huxleyi CCMP1516]